MSKARAPRKKKVTDEQPQVTTPPPVKEPPPPPPPLTEEEKELLAIREQAIKRSAEMDEIYNREVLPGKLQKLKDAIKKLPKKVSTEDLLKAVFQAMSDGGSHVADW